MKIEKRFLLKIRQGDLFPRRETVGIENEVVMIAKFEVKEKCDGASNIR